MAPKPLRDQITFDSLLEPITPLDPRIVTIADPRWSSLLDEWVKSPQKPTGLDVEYWEDTAFDVFSVQVRLIQAAFTSTKHGPVCFIADFGGVDEDRQALRLLYGDDGTSKHTHDGAAIDVPSYRPGSFLHALREVCESRTAAKLLHNAKGDALRLRIAFGIRMRNVRCTMILSQLYWAGIKGVKHGLGPLSERAVANNAPQVWRVEKRLQKSEWRWRLSNAQINYAAYDALIMEPLCSWIGTLIRKEGLSLTARAECDAICAFAEFEFNGMCVDPAMLDDHIAIWKRGRDAAIKPFRERYPDVSPSKPQEVAVALSQDNCYNGHVFYELDESRPRRSPVYIRGQRFDFAFMKQSDKYEKLSIGGKERIPHSVSEAALVRFAYHPWISALLDWRSMGVVIKWMEGVRRRVRADGRVRGEYAQIAGGENRQGDEATSGAGMGRSACIARGTLVQVACDRSKYPDGVPIEEIAVGDLAYCYDAVGQLHLRRVLAAWSNGTRPVIRIHWQGGGHKHRGYLDLTADHQIRLTTGEYRAAQDLQPGDRVNALHASVASGYNRLFATGLPQIREHRFIYEQVTGQHPEHVHHQNHNKLDNRPVNLVGLTSSAHLKLHGANPSESLIRKRSINAKRRYLQDPQRLARACAEANRLNLTKEEIETALDRNGWSITRTKRDLGHDHITLLNYIREAGLDVAVIKQRAQELDRLNKRGKGYNKKICKLCGLEGHFQRTCGKRRKRDGQRLCSLCGKAGHYKGTCGNDKRRVYPKKNNHEVLSIEVLNRTAEVFDLTIDEFPNFIAGELCAHNCRSPSLQQSANPQPKLNRIIAQAMGWVGDAPSMSPRLPFVPHNQHAAAYARWAALRLRGIAQNPFQTALNYAETGDDGDDDAQQPLDTEDDWSVDGDDSDDDAGKPNAVASSPQWFDELASHWDREPRAFLVADFSQAHMRIAAQASQDPQLCEDFIQDRDAHLKLAYDFGVATKQVPADLPEEAFFAWYDKKHPKHKFVKSIRGPAKTGNYTSLNLGSVERLKQAGDTAKPPVVLTYTEWGIIRDAWRKRYTGLLQYQQKHIRDCNATDVVIDGAHYGVAWSLVTGRRLWLRKERDKYDKREPRYCVECGQTHGRLTVRGTDAVAFRWLSTEACAIKYALGKMLEDFDRHDLYFMARGLTPYADVWDARMGSMAHDEVDVDARSQHRLAVAGCIRHWFAEGLRWSGVRDVPVEAGDARDVDLIVKCWADK